MYNKILSLSMASEVVGQCETQIVEFIHDLQENLDDVHNRGQTDLILITKTCLYNIDPLKPHFYIVKLGFTGVYIIFLISAQKHRLWVLVRTASSRRF